MQLRTYTAVARDGYCLSPAAASTLGAFAVVLLLVMAFAAVYAALSRRK